MDCKQVIDSLKWVRSAEEIRLLEALAETTSTDTRNELMSQLSSVFTKSPLREAGLETPVFYAFQARVEWEILGLADILGEKLQEEYGLHPAGQSGIGLNWVKLNERIWVPADYLEARTIEHCARAIFSCDEANCFGFYAKDGITEEDLKLQRRILRGSGESSKYDSSSQSKIKALLTDAEWRKEARVYSQRLLYAATKYKKYVKPEFVPVLEALVVGYQTEMR